MRNEKKERETGEILSLNEEIQSRKNTFLVAGVVFYVVTSCLSMGCAFCFHAKKNMLLG